MWDPQVRSPAREGEATRRLLRRRFCVRHPCTAAPPLHRGPPYAALLPLHVSRRPLPRAAAVFRLGLLLSLLLWLPSPSTSSSRISHRGASALSELNTGDANPISLIWD